jgi:cephalosporin-C deacetylase-like acetyl esterase
MPFQWGVRHPVAHHYVEFTSPTFRTFYCYFQRCPSGAPAPLLVHLPGYGGEASAHPELVAQGYNVLHINPQGYATPQGPTSEVPRNPWPVLPDTVLTQGSAGYRMWLRDAIIAVRWALAQPSVCQERLAFFGTSQGGGTALLMASIMRDCNVRAVAADVPFLTNFPLVYTHEQWGAYNLAFNALATLEKTQPEMVATAWRAIGYVDTLSHAHRLTMPVLLTAGTKDTVCPPYSIKSLYECLPGTRSYTELSGQGHGYSYAFPYLAGAWFRLYV